MAQFNFPADTIGYSVIRFSTPGQAEGGSFDRQVLAAEIFCRDEAIELDRSLHEIDIRKLGRSAFRGTHVVKGPLRKFLNGVDNGTVTRGSVLLVSEWNRLTRQVSSDALKLVFGLMEMGIGIVDLQDRTYYTLDRYNADVGLQLGLQLKISMAHQYSQNLRHNNTADWVRRREHMRAGEGKAGKNSPKWLQVVDGKFLAVERDGEMWAVLKPEHAAVIARIQHYRSLGYGEGAIAKLLNTIDKLPSITGSQWWGGTVRQLVRNERLRGIYQPCNLDRSPDGDPILGFYPRVLSDDDWFRMQWPRVKAASGPKSNIPNLLTGLCRCKVCGSGLSFVNKGEPKVNKNGKVHGGGMYLQCRGAKRGVCTNNYHHPYPILESEFLDAMTYVDYTRFLDKSNPAADKIAGLEAKISTNTAIIDKMAEDFGLAMPKAFVIRAKALQAEVDAAQVELAQVRREAQIADATEQQNTYEAFRTMVAGMPALNEDDLVDRRVKIGLEIKKMVESAEADGTQMVFTLRGSGYYRVKLHFERSRFDALVVVLRECEWTTPASVLREGFDVSGLFRQFTAQAA